MSEDNILSFKNPSKEIVEDSLTSFLRSSAQDMLKIAINNEVAAFIDSYKDQKLEDGSRQLVRNGYLPKRYIQTGIGSVEVKLPRVRDRGNSGIVFTSNFIPKYMRRTVTIDILLPLLYLKGLSTKDFKDAFVPILGESPKNMSPGVISKLKESWYDDYTSWQKRDLSSKRYVYIWADGVYLQARMESEKNCILVLIGADEYGNKEVIAINDGYRESKQSWKDLLEDLKSRGLNYSPKLAIGDGAMGLWGALTESYPECKHQRCWVHKTANLLDKLPKSSQSKAKSMIHTMYMSENKKEALLVYNNFIKRYDAKFPKLIECLVKDKDELFEFYNFPAEHWVHIRTTNPIESTFATVRHRTKKSKNCFSSKTIIASVFKLFMEARKRWKPLRGKNKIVEVINLEVFVNGINEKELTNNKDKINHINKDIAA